MTKVIQRSFVEYMTWVYRETEMKENRCKSYLSECQVGDGG